MKRSTLTSCWTLLLSCALVGGARDALAEAPPASSVVPLDVQYGPRPVPVAGEGKDHLLYEMRLTNFSGRDITLQSIDVSDGATGAAISHHDAGDLADMIATPGRTKAAPERVVINAGSFVVIHFDTVLHHGSAHRTRLRHVIRIDGPAGTDADSARRQLITETVTGDAAPLIVGSPLRGAGWLAANALSNTADHRRTIAVVDGRARIAQRYAIDFVQLDQRGRAFIGDPARNEAWTGYGAPVLAVADGVVEAVRDDLPDNTPLGPPTVKINVDTIGGNHVVLTLPGGQRVFYGHLRPGSIRVAQGQKVKAGTVLAALGNSGQSDAPHLHIHVADGPSSLGAEGLAFAFRSFRLQGHVPSLDVLENEAGWQRPPYLQPDARHDELPLENAVVDFAAE